ncbi:hypothetical protein AN639_07955 [Candidatus Epulonipiscium fishelsonii]|uniref:Uncharacterized protein n=1 Tax=Candidatus Epulonipiscium fishelsonii TaxID=77094 RepID=A0ACC8X7G1_9FIRM|nr:hypothetical protein AN396_12665 [Epulopiscium sp. SCG-B11WGA-EpuloA1]ONI38323.1 hypothetical protein AN639_07955 [Epulopiscium sp. SCG-B05WGA-EpuloA1]
MNQLQILKFLNDYGLLFIFFVVFMEHLNLPGFPSGIIMPAIGLWASTKITLFLMALGVSVLAGLSGTLILYYIGKYGGKPLIDNLYKRHPKIAKKLKGIEQKLIKNASITIFITKLIPMIRTLVAVPIGASGIKTSKYLIYSSGGIAIWNGTLMLSGTVLYAILN